MSTGIFSQVSIFHVYNLLRWNWSLPCFNLNINVFFESTITRFSCPQLPAPESEDDKAHIFLHDASVLRELGVCVRKLQVASNSRGWR